MENRKRNIQLKFWVSEEEKRLIDEKMKQLPIRQYGAYFRKMAIDGYILVIDRSDTKAYIRELQAVSRNIRACILHFSFFVLHFYAVSSARLPVNRWVSWSTMPRERRRSAFLILLMLMPS